MDTFTSVATWLQATGPYGLVAVLGWAFWRVNEKKDAQLRELFDKVAEMGRVQTEAVTYVSGRSMSLMALFGLAGLLACAAGSAIIVNAVFLQSGPHPAPGSACRRRPSGARRSAGRRPRRGGWPGRSARPPG